MLRVSFQGLTNEMNLPSGEIWPPAISGLQKKSSRSMIGGSPPAGFEGLAAGCCATEEKARSKNKTEENSFFIGTLQIGAHQFYAFAGGCRLQSRNRYLPDIRRSISSGVCGKASVRRISLPSLST